MGGRLRAAEFYLPERGGAMNWCDIATDILLLGCMIACMHMWYMQGKLDGLREAKRIIDECFSRRNKQ